MSEIERSDQDKIICSGCGKTMSSSLIYCSNCGKRLPVKVSTEESKEMQSKSSSEEAWPMHRHDPSSTGSDGSSLIAPLEKVWEFQAGGDIESPLAAAYGLVFFGCKDKSVYAVDASSGTKKWVYKTQGKISECPVVGGELIYVASKDKNIYAIEARTGQKRWQFSSREEISTPAVALGKVFFGCKDKNVYALDADTGQKRWEYRTDFKDHSPPTLFEGKVFISGSGFTSKKSFALEASTGNVMWELKDYGSDQSPIVASDSVVLIRSPKSKFAMIDMANGKETGELFSELAATIARSGGFLFSTFKSPLAGLYAADLSRARISFTGFDWAALIEEGAISAPAIGGDFAFVAALGKKKLLGINIRKFMKRWEFSLNEDIKFPPVVANGMMFVASEKGKIHALKGASDPHAMAILEHISGEIAPSPKFRAVLSQAQFIWPSRCCLCCGPAEKTTTISRTEGKVVFSMPNLPYCASCFAKVKKIFRPEKPGAEILKQHPTILAFRNEKYCSMFMEANRLR